MTISSVSASSYAAKFLGSVRLVEMENLSIPEKSFLKDAPPLPANVLLT